MNKITLSKAQLKQLFEIAQSCISNDPARPLLQFAKLSVEGNQLSVVSCNGFKLACIKTNLSEDCGKPFDFYFQPFALPKGTTGAEIEKTESAVTITLTCEKWKLQYTMPQTSGDFVDAVKIFTQTDADLAVALDARLLIEALVLLIREA